MAVETYHEALSRLLAHEGGYTDHPSDPGGPTNFGITLADYRRYVKPNATARDVRAMRLDEAKAIYRNRYWDAMRCDDLPAGLDYAVFDYGVNSGVNRAVKVLQRLVGAVADGRPTDAMIAAIKAHDADDLIARLCDERLAYLRSLKTWAVFGRGWGRRVAEVRSAALAMAMRAKPRPVPAAGKAVAPPAKPRFGAGTVATLAAAGAALGHALARSGAHPLIVVAGVALAVAAAVAVMIWRRRRRTIA